VPKAPAGRDRFFIDSFLSGSAALLWDCERSVFLWINAAAGAALGCSAESLTQRLSRRTKSQLQRLQGVDATIKASTSIKIGVPGGTPIDFNPVPMEIEGGRQGLLLTANREGEKEKRAVAKSQAQARALAAPAHSGARKKRSRGPFQKNAAAADPVALKAAPAPKLTEEEARAFKALGRKVRKLCRQKALALNAPKPVAVAKPKADGVAALAALTLIMKAFDGFLILNSTGHITKLRGKCNRLGISSSELSGQSATALFSATTAPSLKRAFAQIARGQAQTAQLDLMLASKDGSPAPCRVTLGRWPMDESSFFLALTLAPLSTHELPKKRSPLTAEIPSRLAA
jgi:hypothetical protein